ncbi:hypothetical protein F5Y16DRAFT_405482 [Xylariaceae sp. FL0255]|nr:hypothetical protein F5Y16DRAFT_405482 [Xylariaceae sp. FL0255]
MRNPGATQNLLFNPGGPGASGINAMYRFGPQLSTITGNAFHLGAFDPHGVNSSTPKATCYPDGGYFTPPKAARDVAAVTVSSEDREIYAALMELAENWDDYVLRR